jgi:bifunctional UDP-N-acetylglucosamine pyrophosphorylase/glucosamine-1-phosphate N-acetyltransferase
MTTQVVILAAGQGKRMHSAIPKVLHTLAGKPLLSHVIHTATNVAPLLSPVIVFGHQGAVIKTALKDQAAKWVEQTEQLGTGHALLQALSKVDERSNVLVLYGDVPLISVDTLKNLIDVTPKNALGILTATLSNPTGYGRIKRDKKNKIIDIVEEKDASKSELAIQEINTGIYYVPASYLKKWLPKLKNKNAQREYYLTDIIAMAVKDRVPVCAVQPITPEEILGVNDRLQLAFLERFYQHQQAEKFMRLGITLRDPARFDARGDVQMGRDVVIDVNVILENVTIGNNCVIGANVIIRNTSIGDHVEIKANSIIDDATIAAHCVIGPFARLRPGTVLAPHVHIGNFVEIKNSAIDDNSKVNHLSYIGDAEIGARVNIGAGTITCNYDGAHKHKTIIEDDVHIGSDTQLVAPVKIRKGATIGAGSTIIKNAPAHQLTLSHELKQRSRKDWKRPVKKKV